MRGTILDFLMLVTNTPSLARDLGRLASSYGFEFTDHELTDRDMEGITGGIAGPSSDMNQMTLLQLQDAMNRQRQAVQTTSNILKSAQETQQAIIRNMK